MLPPSTSGIITQGNANPPVSLKVLLPEENRLGVGRRAEGRGQRTPYCGHSTSAGVWAVAFPVCKWVVLGAWWLLSSVMGTSQLWAVGRMNWPNTKTRGQQKKQTIEYNFFHEHIQKILNEILANKNQRSTYMTISNNADRVPDKTQHFMTETLRK